MNNDFYFCDFLIYIFLIARDCVLQLKLPDISEHVLSSIHFLNCCQEEFVCSVIISLILDVMFNSGMILYMGEVKHMSLLEDIMHMG